MESIQRYGFDTPLTIKKPRALHVQQSNAIGIQRSSSRVGYAVTVAAAGQATVPDLAGLSRTAAETALANAKLTVGTPAYTNNPASPGSVVWQTPEAV